MHPLIFDSEFWELRAKSFCDVLKVERTLIKVLPVYVIAFVEATLKFTDEKLNYIWHD